MGVSAVHVANPSEPLADIETEGELQEIETGLKKRTDDLEERIARFGRTKPFVIIPNSDITETYKRLGSDEVTSKTLREFLSDEPQMMARPRQPASPEQTE